MRASARTMIAIAATAGVLVGCAKSPPGTATGGHPPKLHLAGDAQTAAGDAAVAPMPAAINGATTNGSGPDIDPGFTGFSGFGGYVLSGWLPDTPTHAPVWRWAATPATKDEIVKLGALVGVTGTPQRHPHGWLLSAAVGEVRVSDRGGHQWSFSRADTMSCGAVSVDIDSAGDARSGSGCAVAVASAPTSGVDPTPPASGPDPGHARAAAATLLSGLNISGSERVDVGTPTSTVTLTQSVGGLVTQSLETSITVNATGVEAATGRLEQPTKGDDYPLRTAKDAFADLNNRPRMMLMPYCGPMPMPMRIPDGPNAKFPLNSAVPGVAPPAATTPAVPVPAQTGIGPVPSCPTPKPTRVTGASLGLQLTYDGSAAATDILVPSWLFTVDGSTDPMAVIAIDPAYLAGPDYSPGAGTTAVEPESGPPVPAPGKDFASPTK